MRKVITALLLVGMLAFVAAIVLDRPSDQGPFHPDHSRVFNGFQAAASGLVGNDGAGSVPPDSECRQLDESTWRCYRRWAPVGRPNAAEILEAEVTVYDDRVVVGEISRRPD